jgi:hypothetical protein
LLKSSTVAMGRRLKLFAVSISGRITSGVCSFWWLAGLPSCGCSFYAITFCSSYKELVNLAVAVGGRCGRLRERLQTGDCCFQQICRTGWRHVKSRGGMIKEDRIFVMCAVISV